MHVADKQFVADKSAPSVVEVCLALAYAFYFASHQHQACGVLIHEEIFVGGAFILDFYDIFLFHACYNEGKG